MTVALLALLACQHAPQDKGDAGETADTEDTGDTGDTGEPAAPLQVTGTVVEPAGTTLDLTLLVAAVHLAFGDGPEPGDSVTSGLVEGAAFTLVLPAAPPAAHLVDLGGSTTGAIYGLVAFEDSDDDDAFQQGELLAGVTFDRYLVWLEAPGGSGLPAGWSLPDLGMGGQYEHHRCLSDSTRPLDWRDGYPVPHDLSDPVEIGLRGLAATLHLAGTAGDLPEGVGGLAGVPWQALSGEDLAPVFDIDLLEGPFSVDLAEAPSHDLDIGGNPDWKYALVVPLTYDDSDEDGTFTDGDTLDGGGACTEGSLVYARYTRPVHTWPSARLLDCYGGNVGWRAVALDPDDGWTTYLAAEQAADLQVNGEVCRAFLTARWPPGRRRH